MERRGSRLSRRQFVQGAGGLGLGLLAGCGRLPWQADQPMKVHRIGYLAAGPSDSFLALPSRPAFLEGLRESGYVEGQNIVIEWRYTEGRLERLPGVAAELAGLPVDILVGTGPPVISAARQTTSTIPIVMVGVDDPVGLGFVASLARPGGNVTGMSTISTQLSGKQLELLKQVSPGSLRVAVLWDAAQSGHRLALMELEGAADVLALQLQSLEVRGSSDFEPAFQAALRERADALVVLPSGLTLVHQARILEFVLEAGLPSIYAYREWVHAGGLMSYGVSIPAQHRRAAYYVDKLLKGAKPADLPVEQPMTFEFVVNMKTAQALGITFPNEIMLQVTEVVQ